MDDHRLLVTLGAVGAVIGIGQILASQDKITSRIIIGRAIIAGGLGLTAGFILSILPALPLPAIVGLASIMVSLGTSGVERLFQKFLDNKAA